MSALKPATHHASRASTVQVVKAKCGVEAWLVEDYAVPIVALDFSFRGGSLQDAAGRAGTATMFSALLDEGAGDLDSEAFHRALDDKAIEIHFSSDRDVLTGHVRTLARETEATFGLLALCLNEARLDDSAIERIRGQLVAGLKQEINDPDSLAAKAFRSLAFAGHPYGLPIRGELETVAKITRADLAAYFARSLARDNVKIAAVGAIDAKTLARQLDRAFGGLPAHAGLTACADVSLGNVGQVKVVDVDLPQTTLRFGRPGIARNDADFTAAMVVNHILGGGVFSARLFKEVREKRGLAYSVYTQLATYNHTHFLMGATSTKNERALESLQVIQNEIRGLGQTGPTADELDKAKKYLTGSYALRFDTSTKIANQLVQLQVEGFGIDYLDERNRLIEAVTMADAQRVSAKLYGDGALLVTAAGRPQGM